MALFKQISWEVGNGRACNELIERKIEPFRGRALELGANLTLGYATTSVAAFFIASLVEHSITFALAKRWASFTWILSWFQDESARASNTHRSVMRFWIPFDLVFSLWFSDSAAAPASLVLWLPWRCAHQKATSYCYDVVLAFACYRCCLSLCWRRSWTQSSTCSWLVSRKPTMESLWLESLKSDTDHVHRDVADRQD